MDSNRSKSVSSSENSEARDKTPISPSKNMKMPSNRVSSTKLLFTALGTPNNGDREDPTSGRNHGGNTVTGR